MKLLNIAIILSTIMFASDLGPLHTTTGIKIIGILSTLLFGFTTYLMFQLSQKSENTKVKYFTVSTGLIFLSILVTTGITLFSGNTAFYDVASLRILLVAFVNTILFFILARK